MTAPPPPGIPQAPRQPRWRPALATWWPLGLFASLVFLILTVTGGVLWVLSGGGSPFPDFALDSGVEHAEGQVTQVQPTAMRVDNELVDRVTYLFELGDGRRMQGTCYSRARQFRAGHRYVVELLPGDSGVNRLEGGVVSPTSYWMPWYLGWLWLPSLLLFLFWFRRVWRTRAMLRMGTAAVARVDSARPVTGVNPPHLAARYTFVDRSGQEHRGAHWVRAASPLGRAVAESDSQVPVVYDELQPKHSRLVGPEDFSPA